MVTFTVTISDAHQHALEAAMQARGISLEQAIAECIDDAAEFRRQRALDVLARAQSNWEASAPEMTDDEVMAMAVEETRAYRREKAEAERRGSPAHR